MLTVKGDPLKDIAMDVRTSNICPTSIQQERIKNMKERKASETAAGHNFEMHIQ
jgi:hypothetical protein